MNGKVVPRPHSGPRVKFEQGPKSWRRRFLNRMASSNNVVSALAHAGVTWTCYTEWLQSGFLTQAMLDDAYSTFKSKHPNSDIIASRHTDEQLEDAGIGVAATTGVEAADATLHGYAEREVLDDDGWFSSDDYEW
jgi:hypothetical protein